MDDEQADVGSSVSLSAKTKATVENVSVKYQGGDVDEIMVEILGSDVLVDGVGGDKGSDFGIEEIGDLKGNTLHNRVETFPADNSEAAKASVSEGDGDESQGEEKLIRDDNVVGPELTKHPLEGKITTDKQEPTNSGPDSSKHNGSPLEESHSSETEAMDVDNKTEHQEELLSETTNSSNKETSRPDGHFSPGDLVWGKVRSHPWWPGQIFDSTDASELALKHSKKDSYLVAYFGDHTFAWNEPSFLKPFGPDFSHIEKQGNSEAFQNAVDCALQEVSRRTELGLACLCTPKEAHEKLESQVLENAGLCEEKSSRRRPGIDGSFGPVSFEPEKLVGFLKGLASSAASGGERLGLAVARAQLSAFYRFKGHRLPSEVDDMLETDFDVDWVNDEETMTTRHKYVPEDATESKKERSLAELMAAKVSASTSQTPKPSFKLGECIRRVANQLRGPTLSPKSEDDENALEQLSERQSMAFSLESSSVEEMVSQLQLLAHNPRKKRDFLKPSRKFFSLFRSSIALNKRGRKRKTAVAEEFEFDEANDSHWWERIARNYSGNNEPKWRYSTGSYHMEATEAEEAAKRRKQEESSPAELILNFSDRGYTPVEINLNKIFRRFGPIMESETEVDVGSGRARVIFKRGSDAEVAHSSAEKFNIFGPVVVDYQICYSPVISVKILPVVVAQSQENPALMTA